LPPSHLVNHDEILIKLHVVMRKYIAIFFLLLFSVSVTEAGQLLKLPFLITHYIDHSQRIEQISFGDFLKEHYLSDHTDDGDEQEDRNLPFKTMNSSLVSLSFIAPEIVQIHQSSILFSPGHVLLYHENIPKDPLFGIFHPPRLT
jgi:hypothetical protein